MTSRYQIGDLVVYKVEYKDTEGVVRGKPRPLIIISEPNSKGDYLAIAGSTRVHQWFKEQHILIGPDMVLGGSLDKPTIFPASKQILIDSKFVRAQIGRIPVEYLDTLLRQCFSQYTKTFFQGVNVPKIESPFIPGKSRINYAGRVYDEKEMVNLVDSSLDFWLTTGRFNDAFEKRFAEYLGVKHVPHYKETAWDDEQRSLSCTEVYGCCQLKQQKHRRPPLCRVGKPGPMNCPAPNFVMNNNKE